MSEKLSPPPALEEKDARAEDHPTRGPDSAAPTGGAGALAETLNLPADTRLNPADSEKQHSPAPGADGGAPVDPRLARTVIPPVQTPADPEKTRRMAMPPPPGPAGSAPPKGGTLKPLLPGSGDLCVPGYEILTELGRGGMGVVFKARQLGANRLVALKMVLGGGYARAELLQRFHIEAQAVARLQHPNIVQVYEVGEHKGQPFYSLELLEGGSLADRLDGTPWPARAAAETVETLARAIHHAHERGIVHRDLKPANVLLASGGCEPPGAAPGGFHQHPPLAKITDFGLAKLMESESGQTHSGDVLGTPSYMAPEQALGKIKAIGPATDVYALGAILYELGTGRPPFKGTTVLDTLEQVRIQEPVSLRELHLQVPRDLETICLKCLHKEPARRYASALELAEDLRRFRAGEPIRARAVSTMERVYRWSRRNPKVAGLLAALIFVTVAGLVSVSALWLHAESQRRRAEGNLQEALSAVDLYFTNVSENKLLNEPGAAGLRRDLLLAARDYYERFVRDNENDPKLRAELGKSLYRLGQILAEIDTPAQGIKYHERALALFQRLSTEQPKQLSPRFDLAATHHQLGRLHRLLSQTDASREHYQKALTLWEELVEDQPRSPRYRAELARTQMGLGNLSFVQGRYSDAEAMYRKALEERKRLVKEEPGKEEHQRDLAVNHDNLADVLDQLAQSAKADQEAQEAQRILLQLVKDHPAMTRYRDDLARSHFNAGKRLALRGEAGRARTAYQEAAERWRRLGGDHPLVALFQAGQAAAYHNQGDVLRGQQQFAEAEKLYAQALKIKQQLTEQHPDVPDYQRDLALAYRQVGDQEREQGDPDKARAGYEKGLKLLDQLADEYGDVIEYQSERIALCNELGLLQQRKKEYDQAERTYRKGMKIGDDLLEAGKRAPEVVLGTALCRSNLAELQRERKDVAGALKGFTAAIEALEKLEQEKYRPAVVRSALRSAYWGQARVLEQQGEEEKAVRPWQRALAQSDEKEKKLIAHDRAVWRVQRAAAERVKEPAKALERYTQVIPELESLLREPAAPPQAATTLRNACAGQAQTLTQLGKHAEAARTWNLVVDLEERFGKGTLPAESRKRLHHAHWMRARALTEAGEFAEALVVWDRVLELTDQDQRNWYRLYRLDTLARSGAHAQATQEADALMGALDSGAGLIGIAGVHAVAAGVAGKDTRLNEAERSAQADRDGRRAVALLEDSEKKGGFKQPARVKRLQMDRAFDGVRERADFQLLLKRLSP